jgi:hypothetical protein
MPTVAKENGELPVVMHFFLYVLIVLCEPANSALSRKKNFVKDLMLFCVGCPVRVLGRRVSRGVGLYPGRPQGHRKRHRDDQDDAAHQGPAAQAHTHSQESSREGPGELHRSGGTNCRQRYVEKEVFFFRARFS